MRRQRAVGHTLRPFSLFKSPQLELHVAHPASYSSWTVSPLSTHLSSPLCSLHSSMKVTVGAHDIKIKEETQQIFPVTKCASFRVSWIVFLTGIYGMRKVIW